MYSPSENRFLKINFISIVTLFVLILAGGVVRSSGSGMGCPDWPKCFDQYVPPTHISQLPPDYREKYVQRRVAKNEKFAHYLDVLGYGEMANRIRSDKSILQHEEFNATNTWIEYVNRLVGAVYGILLLLTVIFSVPYLKSKRSIFFLSLFNVILVGFQGWLGSIVVSTNLLAWVVTVHMLLALAILAISLITYFKARILRDRTVLPDKSVRNLKYTALLAVVVSLVQIALGTTVREQVDAISAEMNHMNRSEWLSWVGMNFNLHRDLAILVIVVNAYLFLKVRKNYTATGYQFKFASYLVILIGAQLITVLVLSYLAFPPVAQTSHLVLACLLFGAQFYLMLLLGRNKSYSKS